MIIPFPKPVTIFEKVCSRGFSEPFWLTCKGNTKQLHTASAMTWILGCKIQLKSYQINNHLFSIANNLWIKVPLEAIHLKESTIRILNTCYRRILLTRNTNWYIKITKITMNTIYILNWIWIKLYIFFTSVRDGSIPWWTKYIHGSYIIK